MKSAEERIADALAYCANPKDGYTAKFAEGVHYTSDRIREILAPPPKRHTFSGVVFEETGEVRTPHGGDWYLAGYMPHYFPTCWDEQENHHSPSKILRYVGGEEVKDD